LDILRTKKLSESETIANLNSTEQSNIVTRFIGVISGKGGVGKTTFVSNVSTILSQYFGRDVTIIDCNLTTSHLGLYMGIFFTPITLNDVLKGEATLEEALYQHPSGVKIVPASLTLSGLEGVDIFDLDKIVKKLEGKTEIVFLDSAPGIGREAMCAIRASKEIIFVTTPFLPCITDIIRCKEVVEEVGAKPLGIVLNMVTNGRGELKKEEVEKLTDLPVLVSIPYDSNIRLSLGLATPLFLIDPRSKASKELLKFSASLIGLKYKESLMSRIFSKLKFW
jgi:septum site-determining protein MinD